MAKQRAFPLIEARTVISNAFSQEYDSTGKKVLRSAFESLSGCPMQSYYDIQNIEFQILEKVNALTIESSNAKLHKLNQ